MPTESDRLYTATLFLVRLASRLPADDPARKGAVHWLEREGLLTDATRCVLGVEADVPLPHIETVEGKVVSGGE